ncbi:unnamed protein product, partial [Calicophoron daubneyi]
SIRNYKLDSYLPVAPSDHFSLLCTSSDKIVCQLCKEGIANVKRIILNGGTDQDIIAALKVYCGKFTNPEVCMGYWEQMVNYLKSQGENLDVDATCKMAGQCK